jgi:endo-1,3(4)-beta-glucanase
MILSASELGNNTILTTDTLLGFSANVNLAVGPGAVPAITFPLVQGMAFVTGVYTNSTPLIQTGLSFNGASGLLYAGHVGDAATTVRYNVTLNDGHQWLIYLTPAPGSTVPVLTALNSSTLLGDQPFTGSVQIAKNPNAGLSSIAIYDNSAGVYPISGSVSGSTSGASGSYSLSWTKGGITSRPLLMFALPHHTESIQATPYIPPATTSSTHRRRQSLSAQLTTLQLQTTTKGIATAIIGDSWTLLEDDLPQSMGFAPWSPALGSVNSISAGAQGLLNQVAAVELAEDMDAQTNLNSMYYAGKGLAKFAAMIWTVNELGNNAPLASAGLVQLKGNFSRFVNNQQMIPLVYDPSWGGIISSTLDPGADFGNAWYNDHHFHYGYFVYAAAVIAYLDPSWLQEGTNKAWVDTLLRDYANPSTTDAYFPFSRMFDWYVRLAAHHD